RVFGKDEVRAGYFPPAALEIVTTLSYLNADGSGVSKTLRGTIPDPLPQTHYQIILEAGTVQGSGNLSVLVDESLFSEVIHISEEAIIPVEGPVPYGDLLITEIMYNPAAIADTEGEWLEIYNNGSQAYDIFQVVIKKGSEVQHIINEHLLLNPGEYLVLARHVNSTSAADYFYGSSLSLTNTGDNLVLANYGDDGTNGTEICSVNYALAGFPDANGATLNLDPVAYDVELAKSGANWCIPTSVFDTGDFGTPGGINDSCTL
ncbi:MAG: lamin tail domain-containing protein, partial [Cyclobacteriaceae bacterium]|nr:lamin tail domain-containing protein [Cyclobacteriaceae bacterium]